MGSHPAAAPGDGGPDLRGQAGQVPGRAPQADPGQDGTIELLAQLRPGQCRVPGGDVTRNPYQPTQDVDVIVLGGMGLKYDDYLYFKNTLENGETMSRTVMFIHTAADPTVECMKVPDLSLAVAEQFALQGKNMLVLLTDMTNFADAMKEIAITQEQVPSNRGYPGDLYSQLASRYEKRSEDTRLNSSH